jgi:hypothetical protein
MIVVVVVIDDRLCFPVPRIWCHQHNMMHKWSLDGQSIASSSGGNHTHHNFLFASHEAVESGGTKVVLGSKNWETNDHVNS